MNGAESLVHTLLESGVNVCFTNPGTSEMHFVSALDRIAGMRCVLGLFEGVVTGAADGYWRIADKPASTLLHLGPGLGNGLANLHNAKKARSGVVNVVGEHATYHVPLNAPLTSDIEGVARPMSHWVRTSVSADDIARDGKAAVAAARTSPGQIATLVLPADTAWTELSAGTDATASGTSALPPAARKVDADRVKAAAATLTGPDTLLLLGGKALRDGALVSAGRIAARTGCALMSEFAVARVQRGAGRVAVARMPYVVEVAQAALARFRKVVLVGTTPPVAFFAYPGKPSMLAPPGCEFITLAEPDQDLGDALAALADRLDASATAPAGIAQLQRPALSALPGGKNTSEGIAAVLAALLPEQAIVVDESVTIGRAFGAATAGAAPHDWLTGCGGAIGYALPVAVGAAVAAPDRRVVVLEGDGSGMYTPQALWTMAREGLNVTVVVFANRSYQILRGELIAVGAGEPGPRANQMLTLDNPTLDWTALARGMGVPATRADDLAAFADQFARSLATPGPSLIELTL
ncbi:MAG: acetolactate synthase large subunit [Burkholderiaceae bacterium]|nr:acetolactate synthase large subunit [Burkholderiaceae bacterium]